MAKINKQLLVKIEQAGKITQHRLGKKDRLLIGRNPGNDITIHNESFPKKHTIFKGKNNHFQFRFNELMKGEILAGESRLNFRDLVAHDLLPVKRGNFTYPITTGRKGIVVIGDAKITFQCAEVKEAPVAPALPKFEGFSWTSATLVMLGRDWRFKLILSTLVVLTGFLLKYMNGLPTSYASDINTRRVAPRLARIIVKKSESDLAAARRTAAAASAAEDIESDEDVKAGRGEKSDRDVRPESQGLLGLLTGSGSSSQSNNLADFLLDKGLVDELDKVMAGSDLSLGQGTRNRSSDFDNLIAQSSTGGGIDDILGDIGDIETVSLGKKGQVQVDRIGGLTGSEAALGKRSEDSVRDILRRYTGRLTYIYNKYLKRDPELRGKMVVEVVIAATGSVAEIRLVTSTMNHPEFEREILSFIRRWKYSAIERGAVSVTYPLFFNRVG